MCILFNLWVTEKKQNLVSDLCVFTYFQDKINSFEFYYLFNYYLEILEHL